MNVCIQLVSNYLKPVIARAFQVMRLIFLRPSLFCCAEGCPGFILLLLLLTSRAGFSFQIETVTLVDPVTTRGMGDQFPWTQLANGDHVTVVNDGVGPQTEIGNDTNRHKDHIWPNVSNTYNFKPWLVTDMDLSNLNDPQWSTEEIGFYFMGPFEKMPGSGAGVRAFYSFGVLALGNDTVIVSITLTGNRHTSRDYIGSGVSGTQYRWGGSAFIITTDGGKTWRLRDGTLLHEFDWTRDALPVEACTFIPANVEGLGDESPFTMPVFMQMGPGYSENEDGYVYVFAPNGHLNEHETESLAQRQTVLARCFIGKDHGNPTAVWDPGNWQVWEGKGWTSDFSSREPVMLWPHKGTAHGQAWYPSVVYLPGEKLYLALASTLQPPVHRDKHSAIAIFAAGAPQGPWNQVFYDNRLFLQGDPEDRMFSTYWIPGWCGIDAGADEEGNRLIDCYFSASGLGNTTEQGWNPVTKRRYGVNVGKFQLAFKLP